MKKSPLILQTIKKDISKNKWIYIMAIPVIVFYICFSYIPMAGIQIAFKDFNFGAGIWGSPWVGFKHFISFFQGPYAWRVIRNTLLVSLYTIVVCFPAPILFALLLNEAKNKLFKRTIQTVSYLPHFISLVVICGLIKEFTQSTGLVSTLLAFFGVPQETMLLDPERLRAVYVISDLWQTIGWNSIIYLAALAGIDQEQYEAARVDGAGRIRQIISVTLPGLMPTITILFILKMGNILNVGFEKILLLYSPTTYEVADVISTYVYRIGILDANFSYSTAIGLFNSVVNIIFLLLTNAISKKMNNSGLF